MGGLVALPSSSKHGTGNAYSNYGCRCQACCVWKRTSKREYRERNKARFQAQRRAEYAKNPERFKELARVRNERHRRILGRYKMLKGCARCGYCENPRALEFHHRDPKDKLFNISMHVGKNMKDLMTEVKKCDVLCSNCHAIVEGTLYWAT